MSALDPNDGARRLAEIYLVVGPLYRRVLRAVEEDSAATGIDAGQRAVLDMLRRHGPMTVPQLAREQELTRQFVQRMVNAAAEDGFVRLIANPTHRRSALIELTGPGRAAINDIVDREHRQLQEACEGLTAEQIDTTLLVLRRMLAAIDLRPT
jgi:DNA-binding MarR family transcriptional regulator